MDIISEVNKALYRPLKNGYQYDKLIPKFQNSVHHFDKENDDSNTYDTLQFMQQWTVKYYKQLEKVAPFLKGATLQQTVSNIYKWLYSHFQYNIDTNVQKLFAPSSAWYYRKKGIDCKSYSVLASCLLLNLDIPHSFRKVKLRGSNNWGHVYVIVHTNSSYYVIDATTHDNKEVNYNEKYDLSMSGLTHIGLASPLEENHNQMYFDNAYDYQMLACSCQDQNPIHYLAASEEGSDVNFDWISKLFKDLNLSKLFDSIKCWGGTAFDANRLQALIPEITKYFLSIIAKYNKAIEEKRFEEVHKIYTEYWLKRNALILTYITKFREGWNPCSNASFEFLLSFLDNKIWKVLGLAFEKHIVTYFEIGPDRIPYNFTHYANSQDYFDGVYLWGTHLGVNIVASEHSYSVNNKPKTEAIPAFIITTEIESALNSDVASSSINLASVMQTLLTTAPIIFSILGTGDGTSGNTTGDFENTGGSGTTDYPNTPKVSKAGFGTAAGVVMVLAAGAYMLKGDDKTKTVANV